MRLDNATLEKLAEDAITASGAIMGADTREKFVRGIIVNYNAKMDKAEALCGTAQGKLKKFTVGEDKIEATVSGFNDYDIAQLTKMKGRMVVIQGDQAEMFETRGEVKEEDPPDDRQPDLFDAHALETPNEQNMTVGAVLTCMETIKDANRLILVDKGQKCTIAAINGETGSFVIENGPSLGKEHWGSFAFYLADNPDFNSAPNTDEIDDPDASTGAQGTNEAPDTQTPEDAPKEAPKGKNPKGKKKIASPRPFFAEVQEKDLIKCKEAFDAYKAGRSFEVMTKNLEKRELTLLEIVDVETDPNDEFQGNGKPFPASFELINENFERAKD